MGQAQSQGTSAPASREPVIPVDPAAEAERIAEQRARAAAAAEARMSSQNKQKTNISAAQKAVIQKKKGKGSALEQAAAENRGWREVDKQSENLRWD